MKNDKDKLLTAEERRELEKLRKYKNNRIKMNIIRLAIVVLLIVVTTVVIVIKSCVK